MSLTYRLKGSIQVANRLGESILWDDRRRSVLWTDMPERRLYIHEVSTETTRQMRFDEDLCSLGLIADSDHLVCAFQSGIAILDPETGAREWLYRLPHAEHIRLNDGRVDRQGRFWVGSMLAEPWGPNIHGLAGELLCLDAGGAVRSHLSGVRISNSLCWSLDGKMLYFADSPLREIYAVDFDVHSGTLSNRRVFARTPQGTLPDGSTVDSDGFLWNAEWGKGRVVRYAADGRIDAVIQIPVPHPTCLTFGGDDLTDLYVTTATYGLSDEALPTLPEAGNVFVFETSVHGMPEERYVRRRASASELRGYRGESTK